MKKTRVRRVLARIMVCLLVLGVVPTESYFGYFPGGGIANEVLAEETVSADTGMAQQGETAAESEAEAGESEEPVTVPADASSGNGASGGEQEDFSDSTDTASTAPSGNTSGSTNAGNSADEVEETTVTATEPVSTEADLGATDAEDGTEVTETGTETDETETGSEVSETETEEAENTEDAKEASVEEPSDGSLAGSEIYFKDMASVVQKLYVLFDGGTCGEKKIEFVLNEEGYFEGTVPEGDYSRLAFWYVQKDGTEVEIRPSWHYYGGETSFDDTKVTKLSADKISVFTYVSENELQYDEEDGSCYVDGKESYWEYYSEKDKAEEKDRVIEPSEGYWAGETMQFVNLYWEDLDLGEVYAVFQGGTEDDQEILMEEGNRGKYSVTIPEGDYSRVSFCGLLESDADADEEAEEEKTAEHEYEIYGVPFQYYGEESAVPECEPVDFVSGPKDTFYYDAEAPERSYWGADALYEGPIGGMATFLLDDAAADQAGNILYFVDLTPDDVTHVKRVTMQFLDKDDTNDKVESVMYEGRDGIYSAPIPEGRREEVTFYMEFDDGTSYQIVRRFNIYEEGSTNAEENFIYTPGEMDAFFFNHVQGEVTYDSLADSYWGPHPSVTNRSLAAQYFYVDTSDRNGNGIILDPETLTIDYGTTPIEITQFTRDKHIYYYQFPIDCSASEQTILTLKGKLGYTDDYTGDKTYEEITFRFCYPYNSNRKMIVADNLREFKPLFEEFVLSETDTIYVLYDNSTTEFDSVQYRVKTEGEDWGDEWTNLQKTDPNDWEDKPNAAVVEDLWGAQVGTEYKYVQFRGITRSGGNETYWYSTSDTTSEDTLAKIPADSFSYPCLYGMKTGDGGSSNADDTTITGVWMSALDVRNLGDSTVDIPDGTFQKEQNAYYGTSTFYDYYTDFELKGVKLEDNNDYTNMTANTINVAISEYYRELNALNVYPLYLDRQGGENGLGLYNYNYNLNTWRSNASGTPEKGAIDAALSDSNALVKEGIEIPLFNNGFLRGSNSAGTNLGQIYNNVHFPFTKNEGGYWEFDSSKPEQTLRMKYDVDEGYFLDRTGQRLGVIVDGEVNSFFPFNDQTDQTSFYDRRHLNYFFGTRFDIPFTLPEGNEIVMEEGADPVPVTFEFSGDDDAWVFVDGQLILDIGGLHNAITGTINFKDGTATVAGETSTFELDSTIENHTLTMFYLERGRGSSNLKVTFNFPKTNTLNVTNEIDTSAANEIFKEALSNIGSFAYRIANKVTEGDSLLVEDSAGYVSLGDPSVFNDGNLEVKNEPLDTQNTDQEIIAQLQWQNYSGSGDMDISDQAYLRFYAYNNSDVVDNAGESIFVAFQDGSGNIIGGWASRLAYDGSSNSLGSKEWSLVRVDINKLQYMNGATTFDRSAVTQIGFAARHDTSIAVKQLEFYKAVTQLPSHGFSVEQENISDYGSVQNGRYELSEVDGAWYGYYRAGLSRSSYRMVENGFFAIGNNERAEFLDKFRVGTYLQITQEDIDPKVFDTSWSIREGVNQDVIQENWLLASRTDIQKVTNSGSVSSLEMISGTRPADGRNVPGVDAPGDGSFVYRSYESPDDDEMNPINLTVAFKNVLKTGSITINKVVEGLEAGQSAEGAVYQFDITFTNIAGMGLADAPITTTLDVAIGSDGKTGKNTLTGIPAGTVYEIHERKQSGLVLDRVEAGTINGHEEVKTYGNSDEGPAYASGIVYASDNELGQEFTFYNTVTPFRMTVEKHWNDANIENERPSAVGIRVWRTAGTSEVWENVTAECFPGEATETGDDAYVELSANNDVADDTSIWRKTTRDSLDVFNADGAIYTYRIEEVKVDGATGWNLDNYIAEYVQGDPITGAYTVTNTPNAIEVRKVWADGEDAARPIAVRVKLQRRVKDQLDEDYEDIGDGYTVELSTNGNPRWAHIFEAVERVNENGESYEYRVVETHLIYATSQTGDASDREIAVNPKGSTNGYRVDYSSNEDNTVLTVKNSKGTGQVVLLKSDRSDGTLLPGAVFKLERLKPRDGKAEDVVDAGFTVGGYNDAEWMVDLNYSSVEYTTDANGRIDFGDLPFGYYRVTEVKAPAGYILLEQPYDFKINQEAMDALEEDGNTYMTLSITNRSTVTLPITGATGTTMFTLTGWLLIMAALFMYKLYLQKARKPIRRKAGKKRK